MALYIGVYRKKKIMSQRILNSTKSSNITEMLYIYREMKPITIIKETAKLNGGKMFVFEAAHLWKTKQIKKHGNRENRRIIVVFCHFSM